MVNLLLSVGRISVIMFRRKKRSLSTLSVKFAVFMPRDAEICSNVVLQARVLKFFAMNRRTLNHATTLGSSKTVMVKGLTTLNS